MKKLIFAILTITSITAHATGNHGQQTSGVNATQVTSVGVHSSTVSGAFATGGDGGDSSAAAFGGTSSATGGNASANGGQANNGGVRFNQVRQTPFAYAPGLAQSFSQDNCANTASIGVSAGFGAISGGAPVESDSCNRRKDVTLWLVTGQNRIACERMTDDDKNMEAMKRAGMDCKALTEIKPPVNVPEKRDLTVFDKMDAIADFQIKQLSKHKGHK